MQMAFTFVTDWILVGKILVGYKIWFCLIQNCFGGIFDWLRFLHSCVLTVNGRFENPVTSGFCHPSISAFEICFGSKKIFSLVQDTFAPLFFPVGKEGIAISSVKFSFFDLCLFLLRDFGLIFTSVSGLLIPVQNDHLKLQIGFCLFCFCLTHPFRPWMRRLTSGADSLLPT